MKSQTLSRRDVLKLAEAAAGGLVLASCGGPSSACNKVCSMVDP